MTTFVPLEANPPGRPPLDRPKQAYHPERGIVDDEDAAKVLAQYWTLHRARSGLYVKMVGHSTIMLHRFVLDLPQTPTKWDVVDHINKNGLDCRRENLRVGSNIQNLANSQRRPGSSRFKGVTWDASRSRWMAQIMIDGKHHYLGRFKDEEVAAHAYNIAASEAWGEFAYLNEIDSSITLPPVRTVSSQYRGVSWIQKYQRWRASIRVDGQIHGLGQYKDEREAALAYNAGATRLLGDKAKLNDVELKWHYGPTDADSNPGRMWCYDCSSEVWALEDGYICRGCDRQSED